MLQSPAGNIRESISGELLSGERCPGEQIVAFKRIHRHLTNAENHKRNRSWCSAYSTTEADAFRAGTFQRVYPR